VAIWLVAGGSCGAGAAEVDGAVVAAPAACSSGAERTSVVVMSYRTSPALLFLVACSTHAPIAPDAEPVAAAGPRDAASAVASLPDATTPRPSAAERTQRLRVLLAEARRAIGRGDLERAGGLIDRAGAEAGDEHPFVDRVALDRALLFAYRQDFAGAARVLTASLSDPALPADAPSRFVFENTLIMLHTAAGDLPAALAACDGMTAAGQRGQWAASQDASTFVMLKEHWHRAYLLRMVAATERGAARAATLRRAEAARVAYRALAAPLGTYGNSIAVLDGFFAVQAGDARAALAAAREVEVGQDDDIEDLYLAQMAFEAGGDPAAARAVRERIAGLHDVSIADAVVSVWLARDGARPERRSPRHPAAPLP
jgi:hypothetical protein